MTLGDQIRRCRLDLGLRQRDLAERWGVCPETVAAWERGVLRPSIRAWPQIIELLGFDPTNGGSSPTAGLEAARRRLGLTRKEFAARVGLDEGSICRWARGGRIPSPGMLARIQGIIDQLGGSAKKSEGPAMSYYDLTRWRRTPPAEAHPRTFGEHIRARRLAGGLSQQAVGAIFGVSRGTVHRWESGLKQPDKERKAEVLRWVEGGG